MKHLYGVVIMQAKIDISHLNESEIKALMAQEVSLQVNKNHLVKQLQAKRRISRNQKNWIYGQLQNVDHKLSVIEFIKNNPPH